MSFFLNSWQRVNAHQFYPGAGRSFQELGEKKKKKAFRMSASKAGKPSSFSIIPISFHSVDTVRK